MTILALHTALPGLGVATAHFAHLFRESHGDGSSSAQQKQRVPTHSGTELDAINPTGKEAENGMS